MRSTINPSVGKMERSPWLYMDPDHVQIKGPTHTLVPRPQHPCQDDYDPMKVLPWVVEGAGGLGAGKTSGAGTRGVDLNAAVGGRTGYTDTNGGESSNN